jgi:NTE family protein
MGADRVAAVYFGAHWVQRTPRHVFEVIGQCFSIAMANMNCLWQQHADITIEPNVTGYAFDDFGRALSLIKIGEEAGREMLPTFRAWAAEREAYLDFQRQQTNPNIGLAHRVLSQPVPLG